MGAITTGGGEFPVAGGDRTPDANVPLHPMIVIATFYKFIALPDCAADQQQLRSRCQQLDLKGTILLAQEGINGTLAGSRLAIDAFFEQMRRDPRWADLEVKESLADSPPFDRMKVRIRPEIVPLGVPGVSPVEQVGTYVSPGDWNALISDPEVLLIDTRNDYEVAIGSFQGATNPQTRTFREFTDYAQRHLHPQTKIAMFCTGGIRCEKASSYLLAQGFEQVYHLRGGILSYLETIPADQSLWQGDCFVFDQRVAVTHGLSLGSCVMCPACGRPVTPAEQTSPCYQAGVCCPHCADPAAPVSPSGDRPESGGDLGEAEG
jgi:UPF0176 protein